MSTALAPYRIIKNELSGWDSIDLTVSHMIRLIDKSKDDERIRDLVERIIKMGNVAPHDTKGEANAVYKFVQRFLHYVKDPVGKEFLRSPAYLLNKPFGDCDDFTVLVLSLWSNLGNQGRIVVMGKGNYPHHVYPELKIAGDWIAADAIYPSFAIGQRVQPETTRKVFELDKPPLKVDGFLLGGKSFIMEGGEMNPELHGEVVDFQGECLGMADDLEGEPLPTSFEMEEIFEVTGDDGSELLLSGDAISMINDVVRGRRNPIRKVKSVVAKNWRQRAPKALKNVLNFATTTLNEMHKALDKVPGAKDALQLVPGYRMFDLANRLGVPFGTNLVKGNFKGILTDIQAAKNPTDAKLAGEPLSIADDIVDPLISGEDLLTVLNERSTERQDDRRRHYDREQALGAGRLTVFKKGGRKYIRNEDTGVITDLQTKQRGREVKPGVFVFKKENAKASPATTAEPLSPAQTAPLTPATAQPLAPNAPAVTPATMVTPSVMPTSPQMPATVQTPQAPMARMNIQQIDDLTEVQEPEFEEVNPEVLGAVRRAAHSLKRAAKRAIPNVIKSGIAKARVLVPTAKRQTSGVQKQLLNQNRLEQMAKALLKAKANQLIDGQKLIARKHATSEAIYKAKTKRQEALMKKLQKELALYKRTIQLQTKRAKRAQEQRQLDLFKKINSDLNYNKLKMIQVVDDCQRLSAENKLLMRINEQLRRDANKRGMDAQQLASIIKADKEMARKVELLKRMGIDAMRDQPGVADAVWKLYEKNCKSDQELFRLRHAYHKMANQRDKAQAKMERLRVTI